jgi:Zn-dependent protease
MILSPCASRIFRIRLNELLRVSAENQKGLLVTSQPSQSVPLSNPSYPTYPLDFGSIRSLIEYRFKLVDAYVDVTGAATFKVENEPIKDKFIELLSDLANHGLMAKIRKVSDALVISVFPKPKLNPPRKLINLLLFIATVGTVSVASYLLIFDADPQLIAALFSNSNLYQQVVVFGAAILGIVGLHETGHVIAVRRHKMDATLPYFVPAPPPFPFGTFGAVISLRSPPVNRDQLFDLGFSGPLAGFLATIVVAVFAILTAPLISQAEATKLISQGLLTSSPWPHTPLLVEMVGLLNLRTVPDGYVLVLTQVAFAAEVGALITFLNVLPVWQLDGGHISRATFGEQGHKFAAIVGFGILIVAGYYGFALLLIVFMFASRRPLQGVEPLDDITPLSKWRKGLFLITLVMLLLSFVIF